MTASRKPANLEIVKQPQKESGSENRKTTTMTQLFSSIIVFNPEVILYIAVKAAIALGCIGVSAAIVYKFQDYL